MKRKHIKPGYMPPAFYEYLMHLEAVEKMWTSGRPNHKPVYYTINDQLFIESPNDPSAEVNDMARVDAYLATVVRSSVKFVTSIDTLIEMRTQYDKEMDYIAATRPLHLPYEWCTLVLTDLGKDDAVISLIETTPDSGDPRQAETLGGYPELNVGPDEKFISASMAFWRERGLEMRDGNISRNNRLSHVPVEIHFTEGELLANSNFLNAVAGHVAPTIKGEQIIELIRVCVVTWMHSFHLASMLRRKQIGLPPSIGRKTRPLGKRKKWERPMFEHFVCELEVDEPDPQQTGRSIFQPKKRLHQVRGFPRHLKSGKVIWVRPHWRGDKNLGVVKKDFEMKLHDAN